MASTTVLPATARPLAMRKRPDLIVFPQRFGGATYMGIKDPLSLRYYQLREEEFFILQQLDGHTSAEEIVAAVEREFAPQKVSYRQLQNFLAMLHREGLITSDSPGQGDTLLERRSVARRRSLLRGLSSILALRFRGIDPEPILAWLYPRTRWCFSPWAIAFSLSLIVAATCLVVLRFEAIAVRLPEFRSFFCGESLLWFAVAIAASKILHEFGHGLTCKHFGGECHELGVMLLAFTPCLYVNVSDAWMLPNKWHRVAISGAGILVELTLAAGCTFLWWFSELGLLNSLCLHLMIVCSISTVVFNGNPLLRYDGYYVLSDLIEVPNLHDRSAAVLRRWVLRTVLGVEGGSDRMYPERHRILLIAYSVASFVYRLFVISAILWFCYQALKPYGLQVLAQLLTVSVIAGLIARPTWQAFQFFSMPGWTTQVKQTRVLVVSGVFVLLAAAVLLTPLPCHVTVPSVMQLRDAGRVYVSVPGNLQWAIEPGTAVRAGDCVGRLSNADLDLELTRLRGELAVRQSELESLKRRGAQQANRGVRDAGSQIPAAKKTLADVQQRLQKRVDEQDRLTLRAPVAGSVVPPSRRHSPTGPDELDWWSGQPLDPENRGAYLTDGTLFCLVGDRQALEALLVIDQTEVELVATGQRVRVQVDQLPGRYLDGRIAEMSQVDLDSVPPELAASGMLPIRSSEEGGRQLVGIFYQAKVSLTDYPPELLPGATGRARIRVAHRSLGRRILRYLSDTFRFRL